MSIVQKLLKIDLTGQVQGASMVSLDFKTLNGANPKELGYFLAIWEGNQVQNLATANHVQEINTTSMDGNAIFEKLELDYRDYIIGLGVNNQSSTSICATLAVPKSHEKFKLLNNSLSSVTLVHQSTDSLVASFSTPDYNLPASNKNWLALFEGPFTANMYKGINVVKTTMISKNINEGAVAMNNIPGGLIRFQRYTLIYGMGLNGSGNLDFSSLVAAAEFDIS